MKKLISLLLAVSLLLTVITADDSDWHFAEINISRAWNVTTGAGIVIAIIDTGIDITHPDFANRISPLSYNAYTEEIGVDHVIDDHGHGTAVAGIAGMTAPNAQIMVIKANNPDSGEFDAEIVLSGIDYAVKNGADIINLSLQRPYFNEEDGEIWSDEIEYAAIQNAVAKGVIVVASAGNKSDENAAFPAAYDNVVAVSATKQGGEFGDDFSNYGAQIDISAPGDSIRTTANGGDYRHMTGTSAAAPIVSGVLALIKSFNPTFTPQQVVQRLYSTANQVGTPNSDKRCIYFGFGIVNAGLAVAGEPVEPREFTIYDALEILKYLAKLQDFTTEQYELYDMNNDDIIDIYDALFILKILAGILPAQSVTR